MNSEFFFACTNIQYYLRETEFKHFDKRTDGDQMHLSE